MSNTHACSNWQYNQCGDGKGYTKAESQSPFIMIDFLLFCCSVPVIPGFSYCPFE